MSELSRTQKKKRDRSLQKLGERLVSLADDQLAQIPLAEELAEAVIDAKGIRQHGAKRRQLQYIGVLMRHLDPEPIQEALERLAHGERKKVARFKQLENWRNALIAGDDKLMEMLMAKHPELDRKEFPLLVAKARETKAGAFSAKAGRDLFRYLSSELKDS